MGQVLNFSIKVKIEIYTERCSFVVLKNIVINSPRSTYCLSKSIFDNTLIWGSSRCSIALSDNSNIETYFAPSVM